MNRMNTQIKQGFKQWMNEWMHCETDKKNEWVWPRRLNIFCLGYQKFLKKTKEINRINT